MSRYWSDLIGDLSPYVPGEQPRQQQTFIKLNTNECPYPPSPEVLQAISAVSANELRLYPDPESTVLAGAMAERCGLQPDQVFVGNGSDEVLAHAFQALFSHPRALCFPAVSYSFYPVWCDLYAIDDCQVPLNDDFSIDVAAFPATNGGIIVSNPNAPTGIAMSLEDIETLLRNSPDSVVLVDEAYVDFGGESAVSLIDRYDNLLVVQTLSKSRSLAGLRVGFAMGHADLIEGLRRVKNSFNSYPLDVVAQHAALASLEDEAYFRQVCDRVIATRDQLTTDLTSLGFSVLPSSANFVFARHPEHEAEQLLQGLRERGILVRYFDKPGIDEYLRISIGTDEESAALLAALEQLLGY